MGLACTCVQNAAWVRLVDGVVVPTTIARSMRIGGPAPDLRNLGSSGGVRAWVRRVQCSAGGGCVAAYKTVSVSGVLPPRSEARVSVESVPPPPRPHPVPRVVVVLAA